MSIPFSAQRTVDGELEKRCPKCGEWLPADPEFFFRNSGCPLGLSIYCKPCQTEYVNAAKAKQAPEPNAARMPA